MDVKNFLNPKMYNKIPLLPPEALKYLLTEINNLSDNDVDRKQMLRIADIAKKALEKHAAGEQQKKQYNLKRYFFLPFEKIIFTGSLKEKQAGRISKNSMEAIWDYIQKKLMPSELDEFEMAFKNAIQQKEMKKAKTIINEFNRLAGQKLEEIIKKCRNDDREWRRFIMVIGDETIALDAEELAYYLQSIPEIEMALKLFGVKIAELNGNSLNKIIAEVNKIKDKKPKLLPFYVALLVGCLKQPEHSLRIIQKFYRINDASSAAKCDLSIIGDILLFNAKIYATNFTGSYNSNQNPEETLEYYKHYANIILGIERELDISPISSWGKNIIELRLQVSDALSKIIISSPRLIKKVLGKYQTNSGNVIVKPPHQREIDELNNNVFLLYGIKNYIAASSCNATYTEGLKEAVHLINLLSVAVVEMMRRENVENQKTLLGYLDISKDLIEIIKDENQANIYHKGGLLAMRSANVV